MRKILTIVIALLVFTIEGRAQMFGDYNYYIYNLKLINPAFTGFEEKTNFTLMHRTFGTDPRYSLQNRLLTYEGHIKKINSGIGAGLNTTHDMVTSQLSAPVFYSYQLKIGEFHNIRIGGMAEFKNSRLNRGWHLPVYQIPDSDFDPGILSSESANTLNYSLGVLYSYKKMFFGGSYNRNRFPHFFTPSSGPFNILSFITGINIKAGENFEVIPMLAYFKINQSGYFDINSQFIFHNRILSGFQFRAAENINYYSFNAGVRILQDLEFTSLIYSFVQGRALDRRGLEFMLRYRI
ncbi:MAG: PorP/SprF family type IX secretion system membrane protein [Cytophagaceae bacterium]